VLRLCPIRPFRSGKTLNGRIATVDEASETQQTVGGAHAPPTPLHGLSEGTVIGGVSMLREGGMPRASTSGRLAEVDRPLLRHVERWVSLPSGVLRWVA
jgi:hypothetical protein